MIIREAILEITHRLERHRIPNPRLCAEVLLAHVLDVTRTYLYTHDDRELAAEPAARLDAAVSERISGVPLQYIVGHQEFYGRDFLVNPSVLIPRPETEFIIEAVLEARPRKGVRIIDVGTGSGCIGTTLALELPQTSVFASDISESALRTANGNAKRLGANVGFVCMDLLDSVAGKFDFVVSNPPYVPHTDLELLQREVREHEPHLALFDPRGNMAIYQALIADASRILIPGGWLIMEIGFGMEQSVLSFLSAAWEIHPTKADLQGIPRTIVARH